MCNIISNTCSRNDIIHYDKYFAIKESDYFNQLVVMGETRASHVSYSGASLQ